ncbi:glycosyltransferase family 25 protein [Acidocella sp.]|uniref:glycosyltransferase family 25 protein n=1 Tax=Acidocella sp. TaxID=50710 RepID=UPI002629CEBE|nr:glycosyltransferase family 25 protein [Acidocella sp.]
MPPSALPIYVVSLKRSPERRAAMSERLAALGLEFCFIDAIDGQDPLPAHAYDRRKRLRVYGTELSPYEIACGLSHVKACQAVAASGAAMGLIIEDDVELAPDLPRVLGAIAKLERRFDIIRLAGKRPRPAKLVAPLAGRGLARLFGGACGSQAYVITNAAARRFAEYALPMTQQIDVLLDEYYFHKLNTFSVLPHPIWENTQTPTTIPVRAPGNGRGRRTGIYRVMPRKWPADIARFFYHWRHYRLGAE